MDQVKLFSAESIFELEMRINKWLQQTKYDVKNIQLTARSNDFFAMIIFEIN